MPAELKHRIFCQADLDAYAAKNGREMRLYGNVAPEGVTIDLLSIPENMIGMRGVTVPCTTLVDALEKFARGEICKGNALFILAEREFMPEQLAALEEQIRVQGLTQLLLVFSSKPPRTIAGAVNVWYDSEESARRSHAFALRYDDRMEYDVTAELFGIDLMELLYQREDPKATSPFYIQKLEHNIWSISEEFTRMFLVIGQERALLIDAGFGYNDIYAAAKSLTDLPVDVALTHGHFDHAGGLRFCERAYMNRADAPCIEARQGAAALEKLLPLEDGHVFDLGGRKIETIALPGHSKGSVVFLERETGILFGGDSVLCGPYFLLMGDESVRGVKEGLETLLNKKYGIRVFYPAHRLLFPMNPSDIENIITMLQQVLDGKLKGCPTWIAPIDPSPYKTYRYGIYSVYAR